MGVCLQHLPRAQRGALCPGWELLEWPLRAGRLQGGHQGHGQGLLPPGTSSQQVWGRLTVRQLLGQVAAWGPMEVWGLPEKRVSFGQAFRKQGQKQDAREELGAGEGMVRDARRAPCFYSWGQGPAALPLQTEKPRQAQGIGLHSTRLRARVADAPLRPLPSTLSWGR